MGSLARYEKDIHGPQQDKAPPLRLKSQKNEKPQQEAYMTDFTGSLDDNRPSPNRAKGMLVVYSSLKAGYEMPPSFEAQLVHKG